MAAEANRSPSDSFSINSELYIRRQQAPPGEEGISIKSECEPATHRRFSIVDSQGKKHVGALMMKDVALNTISLN